MTEATKKIASWKAALYQRCGVIGKAYQSPQTWGVVALEAQNQWKIATSFQTEAAKLHNITRDQHDQALDNALNLLELKHYAAAQPMSEFLPSDQVQSTVDKLCAPLLWLAAVGQPVLLRQELIHKVAGGLGNAPGDSVAWAIRQALRGLGLPDWVLPIVGFGAVGGLAFWAYNSFLAPVGRVARSVRYANGRSRASLDRWDA